MKRLALIGLAALALACGDDARGSEMPARDASLDDAAVDAEIMGSLRDAMGTFAIELIEAVPATDETDATPAATSIAGRVYEAPVPSNLQWTLVSEAGDCQLLEPRAPFCEPACTGGAICEDDDLCTAFPATLDVGTVTIHGLHGAEGEAVLSLSPLPRSNIYQPRSTSDLAYPPFEEGGVVVLAADGGPHAPFELSASAIEPLELLSPSPLVLDPQATNVVRWTAPASGDRARIVVRVDISHHGGQKGELLCETADDGELELPQALVQGLIDLGVAGFPSLAIARESYSEPAADAPGIALKVVSSLTLELEIPGFVSCAMPGEQDVCEDGQTCLVTRVCG